LVKTIELLTRDVSFSFGVYEQAKQAVTGPDGKLPSLATRMAIASVAGAMGGFAGVPGDLVNVRMQNDMKLPPEQRRNYKHAFDGVARVTIFFFD
jgi:dicarboxylate transporter 10